jgi:hypothetical protein
MRESEQGRERRKRGREEREDLGEGKTTHDSLEIVQRAEAPLLSPTMFTWSQGVVPYLPLFLFSSFSSFFFFFFFLI